MGNRKSSEPSVLGLADQRMRLSDILLAEPPIKDDHRVKRRPVPYLAVHSLVALLVGGVRFQLFKPNQTMGQGQAKVRDKPVKETAFDHSNELDGLQGFRYDSRWAPSSPSPPPPAAKDARMSSTQRSEKAMAVASAQSQVVPARQRVYRTSTKRIPVPRPEKAVVKTGRKKRSTASLRSRTISATSSAAPPLPEVPALVSPHSPAPPVAQLLPAALPSSRMSEAESVPAAVLSLTSGTKLQFALAAEEPTAGSATSILQKHAQYPLAGSSAPSRSGRSYRKAPPPPDSVVPLVSGRGGGSSLAILQLTMRATALASSSTASTMPDLIYPERPQKMPAGLSPRGFGSAPPRLAPPVPVSPITMAFDEHVANDELSPPPRPHVVAEAQHKPVQELSASGRRPLPETPSVSPGSPEASRVDAFASFKTWTKEEQLASSTGQTSSRAMEPELSARAAKALEAELERRKAAEKEKAGEAEREISVCGSAPPPYRRSIQQLEAKAATGALNRALKESSSQRPAPAHVAPVHLLMDKPLPEVLIVQASQQSCACEPSIASTGSSNSAANSSAEEGEGDAKRQELRPDAPRSRRAGWPSSPDLRWLSPKTRRPKTESQPSAFEVFESSPSDQPPSGKTQAALPGTPVVQRSPPKRKRERRGATAGNKRMELLDLPPADPKTGRLGSESKRGFDHSEISAWLQRANESAM